MSVLTRMARGCHLGFRSLVVVLRDKTLLVFPLVPFTCVIALVTTLWLLVGDDKMFWGVLGAHMMQVRNLLITFGLYLLFGLMSVFFSFGLVTCTRITLEERDSKFLDGFRNASRNLHWVTVWAFISWTFGPILNILDHQRYTTLWVRRILKTSWSVVSYFVVPIVVIDQVNVFSALRRSVDAMSKRWGTGAISRLGLYWFFFFLNIPTIIMFSIGHYPDGPFPTSLTFALLLYFYLTVVVYQTASSVLSVVLYRYASNGTVVPGFKEEHLRDAFAQPRIYVLATESPGDDYVLADEDTGAVVAKVEPAIETSADALTPESTTEPVEALPATEEPVEPAEVEPVSDTVEEAVADAPISAEAEASTTDEPEANPEEKPGA